MGFWPDPAGIFLCSYGSRPPPTSGTISALGRGLHAYDPDTWPNPAGIVPLGFKV